MDQESQKLQQLEQELNQMNSGSQPETTGPTPTQTPVPGTASAPMAVPPANPAPPAPAPASSTPVAPPPAAVPPKPAPSKQPGKSNFLIGVGLTLILIAAAAGGVYFFLETGFLEKLQPTPQPTVQPTSEPTLEVAAPPEPTADWEVYQNETLGFQLKYPSKFKIVEDEYGWPKAVLLLYAGGQSYDLAVEVWDTQSEYQAKYPSEDNLTVKEVGDKYVTLLNNNEDSEVDDIIATFELLESTE